MTFSARQLEEAKVEIQESIELPECPITAEAIKLPIICTDGIFYEGSCEPGTLLDRFKKTPHVRGMYGDLSKEDVIESKDLQEIFRVNNVLVDNILELTIKVTQLQKQLMPVKEEIKPSDDNISAEANENQKLPEKNEIYHKVVELVKSASLSKELVNDPVDKALADEVNKNQELSQQKAKIVNKNKASKLRKKAKKKLTALTGQANNSAKQNSEAKRSEKAATTSKSICSSSALALSRLSDTPLTVPVPMFSSPMMLARPDKSFVDLKDPVIGKDGSINEKQLFIEQSKPYYGLEQIRSIQQACQRLLAKNKELQDFVLKLKQIQDLQNINNNLSQAIDSYAKTRKKNEESLTLEALAERIATLQWQNLKLNSKLQSLLREKEKVKKEKLEAEKLEAEKLEAEKKVDEIMAPLRMNPSDPGSLRLKSSLMSLYKAMNESIKTIEADKTSNVNNP